MIEIFGLGKHTIFIYTAYIFTILILLTGYFLPHHLLKKKIRKIKDDINKKP